MKERWITPSADADQRQAALFEAWISGENIPFTSAEAGEDYQSRATLIKDAIELKKAPARIPICPSAGFFPIQYAGASIYDAMYDYDVLAQAWEKYQDDLTPDAYNAPTSVVPGSVLDLLDFRLAQWPGHGVSKQSEYQYIEDVYMTAEEYQDLIDDPTGFFMNIYLPRIFGAFKPFEKLPLLPPINEIPCIPPALFPFGAGDIQTAMGKLAKAGEAALDWLMAVRQLNGRMMGRGFPAFSGGFTKAPFDVIGDTLRGTREIMMDMYRHPDELIEACERITPFMVRSGIASCKATGHIMPFIPLHKGADGFMSDQQFQTFYWPTLRKVIIGLVDAGIVPQLLAEGGYNQRLEVISEVPKGKVVWWFDNTDMSQAKKMVGPVACIAGNVPVSMLTTGSTDDVVRYCRELMDLAGKDGGFIFSTSAGMQGAKPENVKAMMEFTKGYSHSH